MNIQQQDGFVSTINLAPYSDIPEYHEFRNSLFEHPGTIDSEIQPKCRFDEFDETILVFEKCCQALAYLIGVYRSTTEMQTHSKFSLRSSLCYGSYFMHGDQIYGDAVNLATRLTCSSRENELLVHGIPLPTLHVFLESQPDLIHHMRDEENNCVSIGLLDHDSTIAQYKEKSLKIDFRGTTQFITLSRNHEIKIGRADDADILIDSVNISRHHATIKVFYDKIHLEDHSSNGTFIYCDGREIFLTNDSMKVPDSGIVSCGLRIDDPNIHNHSVISYCITNKNRSEAA